MKTKDLTIIRTKLYRPPVGGDLVCRSRLHELMDQGAQAALTVVSAPAGYGKSMVVSHWAESSELPCAWLSLDKSESDLATFLTYLVTAVQTLFPDACTETEAMLGARNLPSIPVLGSCLVNELDTIDQDFALVLDDYHRIQPSSGVHEILSFILEHPPRPLRLAIVSRHDPPLPLTAMRATGRIAEIRLKDLQFTTSEVLELLKKNSGVPVGQDAVDHLQRQTEGWAVGLRLVALHLRNEKDPDLFLRKLSGGIQHTQDYLLQEVISGQSPEMRDWLLKTSTLDRFCEDLCEEICQTHDSPGEPRFNARQFLDGLQRGNLFTIALDSQGEWFRYHHLFQTLLNGQLRRLKGSAEIAKLHAHASEWFESKRLIDEAIRHALKTGDVERAADIVERNRYAEINSDRWYVTERWLGLLPAEVRQQRPALLLAQAWVAQTRFQFHKIPPLLECVASQLDDETNESSLLGELNFFRGLLLYWEPNADESKRCLDAARAQLPETKGIIRGNTELVLGLARCMSGQKEMATRSLHEQVSDADFKEGVYASQLLGGVAFIHILSGELFEARVAAQRLEALATESHATTAAAWGSYMQGCTHLHTNELDQATHLFSGASSNRYILDTGAAIDALAGLALTHQLNQRTDEAKEVVGELLGFAREMSEPQYLSVAHSCQARVSLLTGELGSALQWARSASETPTAASLFIWLESPSITQARVLIAAGSKRDLRKSSELLAAVRRLSESCRYISHLIEVSVLQSLALERLGQHDEAQNVLEEAVGLARPGGWIRPFVEPGLAMEAMLQRLSGKTDVDDYLERLLAAFPSVGSKSPKLAQRSGGPPKAEQSDLDALTQRELDLLGFLAERLQNKEIAERLFISPHTVNDHLKNIYQKLGVHTRREAVECARRKGIISLQ